MQTTYFGGRFKSFTSYDKLQQSYLWDPSHLNKHVSLHSGFTYNGTATLPDQKKLASAKHVVFNQTPFQILAGDKSDWTEECLKLTD